MTKKALGKGLKAFMPEEYGILKEERFLDIEIDSVESDVVDSFKGIYQHLYSSFEGEVYQIRFEMNFVMLGDRFLHPDPPVEV